MIFADFNFGLTPIVLSFLLLTYLLMVELGTAKMKKDLMPFILSLGVVFVVVFVLNIWSKL